MKIAINVATLRIYLNLEHIAGAQSTWPYVQETLQTKFQLTFCCLGDFTCSVFGSEQDLG